MTKGEWRGGREERTYGLLEGLVAPEGAGVEEPAECGRRRCGVIGGWHCDGNGAVAGAWAGEPWLVAYLRHGRYFYLLAQLLGSCRCRR